MPCYDPRYNDYKRSENLSRIEKQLNETNRKLRKVEAILCGLYNGNASTLKNPFDAVDWKEVGVSRKEAEKWLKDHRERDKKRNTFI